MRWAAYGGNGNTLFEAGGDWGDSRGTSALATGDLDGDGAAEIVVGRTAGDNVRFIVYDPRAPTPGATGSLTGRTYETLLALGDGWGGSRAASAVASSSNGPFVVLGRNRGENMRRYLGTSALGKSPTHITQRNTYDYRSGPAHERERSTGQGARSLALREPPTRSVDPVASGSAPGVGHYEREKL